jgi:hypothetical protein
MSEALEVLLHEALQRPAGSERDAWIVEACRGDAALARDLRELVTAHEAAGTFLSKPLVPPLPKIERRNRPNGR